MARKTEPEIEEGEMLEDADSGVSRVYELGFHLDPELPTEEVKKTYQTIHALIDGKGTIVAEGEAQKIPLAYTISRQETSGRRDFDSAYFAWIAYEASGANHAEIISAIREEKRVIRYIDLVTTKDEARHSAEMHEIAMKIPEAAVEPEATADVELDAALENVAV